MDLPRAWTAFGGASLALMGAALAAGARRQAADNLAWRKQWRQAVGAPEPAGPEGARLVAIYRGAGAVVGLLGAYLLAEAAQGRARVPPPGSPRAVALLIAAVGVAFGARRAWKAQRGPAFLKHEALASPAAPPPDDRAADACVWALCALWAVFGLTILRELSR